MGIATGQGLIGLVRERYGVRWGGLALVALLIANAGTMCAEFAGVAAALGLAGVSRYVSVPLALAGTSIDSATDAARALEPLAGSLASALFAVGLLGAALLAASVLPLSTGYSVCEAVGAESALDDSWRDARLFYVSFGAVTGISAMIVLIPGAPLISILFLTQALNAVLLLPLLWFVYGIARDRGLMGEAVLGRAGSAAAIVVIVLVSVSVAMLLALSL